MKALARTLALVAALAPTAPAQGLDEVRGWLQDSNHDLRRRAVTALPGLGTAEAWELLLGALDDPSPRVADEAQIQLGTLADAGVLADLVLGRDGLKDRDELVRARVAEALGRMPLELPAKEVARALSDKDARVRRMLAWSAQRAARRERIGEPAEPLAAALAKLAGREREPGVRAAALVALAHAAPEEALAPATGALESGEPAMACAGLEALELAGDGDLLARVLADAAAQGDPIPRRCAVRRLEREGTRDAAALLVGVLEDGDAPLRVRWDAVGALRALSGRLHRLDPAPWRDWLGTLPADWTGEPTDERAGPEDGTVSFAGLPVLSDRVVFLIDLSGSMTAEAGGATRKEIAQAALEQALTALPATARFDVIPYYDQPLPWKEKLVEASASNVARALKHVDRAKQSGKGNLWDALELVFADPDADTAIVFSDGVPSGGPHWNFELMRELLAERNRFRQLAIDAVLVEPSGITRKFWDGVCADSGGRCITADPGAK